MKYWCEHPWRGRFENARGEVCAKCGRPTDAPYIDTDTAIERFRNGQSIFTPPRELQAAISNAIRATGRLDDFEVAALVLAGVMKKVHLRHSRYPKEAACGQPYPPDRRPGPRDVRPVRLQRISVGGRIRLTRAGRPGGPPAGSSSSSRRASDAQPDTTEWTVTGSTPAARAAARAPHPHRHLRRERHDRVLGHRAASPPGSSCRGGPCSTAVRR